MTQELRDHFPERRRPTATRPADSAPTMAELVGRAALAPGPEDAATEA